MDKYHTAIRKQLLAQGYRIIPTRGKVARHGWNDQDYVAQQLASGPKGSGAERVERWEKRFPDEVSTGVRIEDGLGVTDIDVDDPLVDLLMQEIAIIAPDVAMQAPTRFGGGEFKLALFCRVVGEPWMRIASRRFNGHCVEIFGGAPLRSGNCARQFGIYGPHSFNPDGSVAREYVWSEDHPQLTEASTGDLPGMTKAQAFAIVAAFERLAIAAGWVAETRPDTEAGGAVYDITDETRFDTDRGGSQITYAELCDAQAAYGDLRCASNFMAGRDGNKPTRCWVYHSDRHDCTAVWVYGDEQAHFPTDKNPEQIEAEFAPLLSAAAAAEGIEPPPDLPNWRERYKGGVRPMASFHNAKLAIAAAGLTCAEDTFHYKTLINASGPPLPPFVGIVDDAHVSMLRGWLSDRYGFDFTEKHVRDAVVNMAHANRFNPVTDMLAEAEVNWDGMKRLDRMAADYFNAEDTELNQQCVRKTMIAAVARARRPGCKFDTILVLEGPEGFNKSSAWSVLAGEGNFSDERILGQASREVQEQLAGIWIHESADLAGMKKAEVEIVKAFASRVEDRARPAYGHFLVAQPRHSIEVGTTNSRSYLHASTGNRRFWPMIVQRCIDLAQLRAHRLQLWGEAAAAQTGGESITLDERLWGAAAIEQEARRVPHPWEARLAEMQVRPTDSPLPSGGMFVIERVGDEDRVSTHDIFEHVLSGADRQTSRGHALSLNRGHAMALAEAMRVLGWTAKVVRIDGVPKRGYGRPVTEKVR